MPNHSISIASILTLTLMAGCGNHTQYSSGADYLAAGTNTFNAATTAPRDAKAIDKRIAQAAAVEPDLRLPGRFGLARLVNGQLTAIPETEAEIWRDLASRHPDFGTFTPISPLVAQLAASSVGQTRYRNAFELFRNRTKHAVELVRIGAGRQHIDTVLIYEAGARSSKNNTALALMDLTIIGGAFLPTRRIETQGVASAVLVDVRNGYPYGTASATADLSSYFSSWGSDRKANEMRQEAVRRVVENLAPEVEQMMLSLRDQVTASQ